MSTGYRTRGWECIQASTQANRDRVWTEEMRRKTSESHKGLRHSEATIQKQKSSWHANPGNLQRTQERIAKNRAPPGTPVSAETRAKMAEAAKRRSTSPEGRARLSERAAGRVWVTNGETTKFVRPAEVQGYLEQGWRMGRM